MDEFKPTERHLIKALRSRHGANDVRQGLALGKQHRDGAEKGSSRVPAETSDVMSLRLADVAVAEAKANAA